MVVTLVPNVWPLQKDCNGYYGNPGDSPDQWAKWEALNLVNVACPWKIYFVDGKIVDPVTSIRIHKRCADSLTRVLNAIWEACNKDQSSIETLHYHKYSGSYNQRPMRGGSSRSMHGFGCAIDWDADENPQHSHKPLFTAQSLLVVKFKAEGWIWGGDWGGSTIDAMHVQASRVHQ